MFKVIKPLSDTYVTNRVVNAVVMSGSNVGSAGSLDLFKLYGHTFSGSTPNFELSRLLIKFDLSDLRTMLTEGLIDTSDPSFNCKLRLYDVYGGQPTPRNFTVVVHPLSASFDEGLGRDVVYYSDLDACNFLTRSLAGGVWLASGCSLGGSAQQSCDYITASAYINSGLNLQASQSFTTGEEDLNVDITTIVSATLAGLLPDVGLRIAFTSSLENDHHTYFVKRFASRTAYNEDLRPKLLVRFDDSIQDDTNNMYLDSRGYMFLYNYVRSSLTNLTSGSSLTSITGSNSVLLELKTAISGGSYSLYYTGSQHHRGINYLDGIYSASVLIQSTNASLAASIRTSGSVTFTPIWQSLDRTVPFLTGSTLVVSLPDRSSAMNVPSSYVVNVLGLHSSHDTTEETVLRVNIFDYTSPVMIASRTPVETAGVVIRDVHYQVRDEVTGLIAIPFDTVLNSTRVSNDSSGMYFKLDMSNLTVGHSYVIDVLIVTNNNEQLYKAASPVFKVEQLG